MGRKGPKKGGGGGGGGDAGGSQSTSQQPPQQQRPQQQRGPQQQQRGQGEQRGPQQQHRGQGEQRGPQQQQRGQGEQRGPQQQQQGQGGGHQGGGGRGDGGRGRSQQHQGRGRGGGQPRRDERSPTVDQPTQATGQQGWRQRGPPQQQQPQSQQPPQQAWRQAGPPQQPQQQQQQSRQPPQQAWRQTGPPQQPQQQQQRQGPSPGFGRGAGSQDFPPTGGQQQHQQSPPKQSPTTPSPSPSVSSESSASRQTPQKGGQQQKQQRPQQQQQQKRPQDGAKAQVPTQAVQKMQIGAGGDNLPSMERKIQPGQAGRVVKLEANHLKLDLGKLKEAYHYDVNLDPDRPKNMLRRVMEMFRQKHYPQIHPAFDGRKNLYSCKLLCGQGQIIADTLKVPDDEGREKEFKVEVKFANAVDLSPLRDMIQGRSPQEAIQCVDIVLRNAPAARCISVGRSFFLRPENRIIDLGEGMEMYYGFYQSAIRCWEPLLNVDVAHKAFPKEIPVTQAICEVLSDFRYQYRMEDLKRGLDGRQQDTFNKYIATLKVVYQIPNVASSRKVYRVNKLGPPGDTHKFQSDDGTYTIDQYFVKKRNIRLQYPKITLWVGSKERSIYIPAELCTIMEGQPLNRKMTENQTSKMIKEAATNTAVRKQKIMDGVKRSNYNADPCVREFGFSVANKFEEIEGRILDPPELSYKNRKVKPSKGVWRNDQFLRGMKIQRWTILETDRPQQNVRQMAQMIERNGRNVGMEISPCTQPIANCRPDRVSDWFQKNKGFDLVVVVVPPFGDAYNRVKSAAELVHGCMTQCIKSRTVGRINDQIVTNLLLKINSKLNGVNHCFVDKPLLLKSQPIMIMGADVTHPSPDSKNIPSVAAVTASHGPNAFKYNICWRLQPPRTEIIDDLTEITKEHLMMFYKHNNTKPHKIMCYRDGVSEGQFEQVRYAEINAIRRACTQIQADGNYKPAITFLVVQKRHHTRLFPCDPRISEDRNCNVPAGTCVDTQIVHPFMQDFYLVSHASIQGVAKPTKYCTIYDDSNLSNDEIEQFTYYLCHMFTRCNRAVSYPAPTYYAHLAAARAKVYVEQKNLNMNDLKSETLRYAIQDSIRKDHPMFFV